MEKITPGDIRYAGLAEKRFNKRYAGKPEYICLPTSTQEVVEAVQEAVSSKRRPVVRSGGHCLEGFVADPTVQVLIDVSLLNNIYYDAERAAFTIEAGATVGEMYRRLFLGWGVILPAGEPRCSLVYALLQGKLSAAAAGESEMGSATCVLSCLVHKGSE